MDITCDSPDCALIAFLNFFCLFPFLALPGSLLRFLLLIVRCFLMEAFSSFYPFQYVSSSFWSLERYLNSCQVRKRISAPVLPRPENVTSETLTGFGVVGLDFVDLRYGSTSIRWLEDTSKSLLGAISVGTDISHSSL